jgi:hypothetical protein
MMMGQKEGKKKKNNPFLLKSTAVSKIMLPWWIFFLLF